MKSTPETKSRVGELTELALKTSALLAEAFTDGDDAAIWFAQRAFWGIRELSPVTKKGLA